MSVVMPVFNCRRFVAEAVGSVLRQTMEHFEFIIVNDGATDGSLAILERFMAQDRRIRLLSRPNRGLVKALNEGISIARGELVARMDADDVSLPQRLERQVEYLRAHPECVALGTGVELIDPCGAPIGIGQFPASHEEIEDALLLRNGQSAHMAHPSVVMRREVVMALGGYREKYVVGEDRDLWLRIAEVGRLANLPKVLLKYRLHAASFTYTRTQEQRQASLHAVVDAYHRRGLPVPDGVERTAMRSPPAKGDYRRAWARMALRAGYFRTARKYATLDLLRRPWNAWSWLLLVRALLGAVINCPTIAMPPKSSAH